MMNVRDGIPIVCVLFAAILGLPACSANQFVIKLWNFRVEEINPAQYQVDGYTDVTFRANLKSEGPVPPSDPTGNISIVFLVLSLNGRGGALNIGNVSTGLGPEDLWEGRSLHLQARIWVEMAVCNNTTADLHLCAAGKLNGVTEHLDENYIDCRELNKDIEEGGAGLINCKVEGSDGVEPYIIALPVLLSVLIVVLLLFLCWKCFKRRQSNLSDGVQQSDYLSRPRKSLAHIYEDLSNRLSSVHMPFRRGHRDDKENDYEITVSPDAGTRNDGFQAEIESNSRGDTNVSVHEETDGMETDGIPNATRRDPFAKRPSQPNQYILEDPSLIRRLSPLKSEELQTRFFLAGVPSGETTDEMEESDDLAGYSKCLVDPVSRHETAVDAEASVDSVPVAAPAFILLKTEEDEGTWGPEALRNRAPSVDMPLYNAPDIPVDSDPDSDVASTDPNPDQPIQSPPASSSPLPSNPAPDQISTDSDPECDPEFDSPYLPPAAKPQLPDKPELRSVSNSKSDTDSEICPSEVPVSIYSTSIRDTRRDHYPKPKPHPTNPSEMTNPDSDEDDKPEPPPRRSPKPPLSMDTDPGQRSDPDQPPSGPASVFDARPVERSHEVPRYEDTLSLQSSPRMPDHKPQLPPKPRRDSEKADDENEEANRPPRPQLPSKPLKLSKSDPGTRKKEKDNEDWSSRSTSSTSKPALKAKPPSLSLYKPQADSEESNISNFPDVKLNALRSPSSSQKKPSVDQKVMDMAIRRARDSTAKSPNSDELDRGPSMPHHASASPTTPKPTDSDFVQLVMENYLSLMYEMSKGDEDYEVAIQNEQDKLNADDSPAVEPRTLRRRKSYAAQLTLKRKRLTVQSADVYVNLWNKSLELDRANLTVDREKPLGEGQFGKVYKGFARGVRGREGVTVVAVKELKDGAETDDKNEFLKELAIQSIIEKHPHVVEILGCCIRDEPICIITEYLTGGNLLSFLRGKSPKKTGPDLIRHYLAKFGLHIARGMAHISKKEIVHRDLAARNILISEEEVCKVADFGFARDVFGIEYYRRAPDKAPIRWYGPESILDNVFSTKSDVWSFGILLFEIATLGRVAPYTGCTNEEVRFKVSAGMHPNRPPNCDTELFKIMKKCWSKKAEDRPSFVDLVDIFEDVQSLYPDPS
ncbi:probable LIM domain-containing serine/threonine-protein kinase DDB_G0286997 isoform X2 [Acanthaster planci]|nr:probable LIM domain-containing serine/threonine-protein kinase DDB_G0286997 isoform X2 [Acanthaster planci]